METKLARVCHPPKFCIFERKPILVCTQRITPPTTREIAEINYDDLWTLLTYSNYVPLKVKLKQNKLKDIVLTFKVFSTCIKR